MKNISLNNQPGKMKKILICGVIVCSLLSCSKQREQATSNSEPKTIYVRGEAISKDGSRNYSPTIMVKN